MVLMRRFPCPVELTLLTLGCAQIADLPGDPRVVVVDEQWGCLAERAQPSRPRVPEVRVTVQACDFLSDCTAPVTGITAKLCGKADVGCSRPLLTDIRDVGGTLEFDVPTGPDGFDGYLSLSGPSALCTDQQAFGITSMFVCGLLPECDPARPDDRCSTPVYAPAFLFFGAPIIDERPPLSLPLVLSAAIPAVLGAAGSVYDPALGSLIIVGADCTGARAAGIRYELAQSQELATRLYLQSGVLSAIAAETDISGVGGFAGLRPGFVDVAAYNPAGEHISNVGAQIAASVLTYSAVLPRVTDQFFQ
jgi:hypothetical protein